MTLRSTSLILGKQTVGVAVALVVAVAGTGCSDLLTPDRVRDLIENPTGSVGPSTVGRSTRDFFAGQKASGAEGVAFFAKAFSGDTTNAVNSAMAVGGSVLDNAIANAGPADFFCAAGFLAALSSFDSCGRGDNCEAELVVDSCLLRVGDSGDQNARGRIKFLVKHRTESDFDRAELRLTFEDFELTQGENTGYFNGILAIETTDRRSADRRDEEVILTSDLVLQKRRFEAERGWFDDGALDTVRASAAIRFTAGQSDALNTVTVDLLAFVDEGDSRNEAVVLTFGAEERKVDESRSLAEATLDVRGSNGSFRCTWSRAEEIASADGPGEVKAEGNCVDQDGETFTFNSTTTRR